ncbi:hypothetical protein K435DRAFT_792499 [Dendrothele bispora CBS 962.96]|uniref:Uncharacterized protein n=1 Tax=Dendrothele bispora (strain CBS 962.96) TaxID=1314807 RepID=A0A4S8MIE7_DENBC|nr:hypothetical protein K435DRAFT_792499 [Dendrothele bispora CBS 962.96]
MTVYRRYTNYPTLLFVFVILISRSVLSVLLEGIIDDGFGDLFTGFVPIYEPNNSWQQGNMCGSCVHPSPANALGKTWHDTSVTGSRSIVLQFTGISITIYCILVTGQFGLTPNMDWTYTLDDGPDTSHTTPQPDESPIDDFIYNVPVLRLSNLSNTNHTLILNANSSSSGQSVVLFDFAKYQYQFPFDHYLQNFGVSGFDPTSTPSATSTQPTSTQPNTPNTINTRFREFKIRAKVSPDPWTDIWRTRVSRSGPLRLLYTPPSKG